MACRPSFVEHDHGSWRGRDRFALLAILGGLVAGRGRCQRATAIAGQMTGALAAS
jgi:hypothetical protein